MDPWDIPETGSLSKELDLCPLVADIQIGLHMGPPTTGAGHVSGPFACMGMLVISLGLVEEVLSSPEVIDVPVGLGPNPTSPLSEETGRGIEGKGIQRGVEKKGGCDRDVK